MSSSASPGELQAKPGGGFGHRGRLIFECQGGKDTHHQEHYNQKKNTNRWRGHDSGREGEDCAEAGAREGAVQADVAGAPARTPGRYAARRPRPFKISALFAPFMRDGLEDIFDDETITESLLSAVLTLALLRGLAVLEQEYK